MGVIKQSIEKIVEWLRFKDNGDIDIDQSFQALFLKSLAGKESSFAILGIRCNSKESTGKRKMDPGRLYQFLQGYNIDVDSIAVEKWRKEQNTLYDDYYTEIVDGKPHIQISAIVGQNGAGKSSIIEFMMRLINNFAAASLGERQLGEAAERLHFIDKVDGELWYTFEDGNDGLLIEHYGMDDIDLDTLHRYRTLFQYRNEGHVWNEIDDKSFLKNLGGYVVARESGKECLTMAGLLMFGKGLSIRERFDNFRMDYIDFCNLIGEERYSDRLTYDGRWENNLYQFFSRVIPKVTFDLPRPFRMEGIQRVDDTPQHKAVREAFTNAIIHSDFIMESGILRIEKHDDKLVFRNPGLLRLPIEQIYEGGVSFARNPKIQNMLRMVGYGENLGSGFPLILDAWKQAGWEKPELKNRIDVDVVELVLPVPSTKTVTTADELPKGLPDGLTDGLPKGLSKRLSDELSKGLSETAVKILKLIYLDNYISRETLAEKTGISVTSVQNHVNKLKSMGILKRIGSAKSGHWEVVK